MTLKATFEPNRLDSNLVNAELWYTTSNGQALDFIKDLEEFITPISQFVTIEPKFVTWACPNCESDFKRKNCLGDGKYCASHHSSQLTLDGVEVLMEDIRQYCIFALSKLGDFDIKRSTHNDWGIPVNDQRVLFFRYVAEAHELCRDRITTECSKLALKALGLSYERV